MQTDDLFKASIEPDAVTGKYFSTQARFLTSFLGGPIASALLHAQNSKFMGCFKKDLPFQIFFFSLGALFPVYFVMNFFLQSKVENQSHSFLGLISLYAVQKHFRLLKKIPAILCFAFFHFRHRSAYRSFEFRAVQPVSPWKTILAIFIITPVIEIFLFYILYLLFG